MQFAVIWTDRSHAELVSRSIKTLGYFRMLRIKSMLDEVDIYLKTKVNHVSNNEEGVYWVQHLNVKQKTQMTV